MRVNLAFFDAHQFLVIAEMHPVGSGDKDQFSLALHDDENVFLRLAIEADLKENDTTNLVTAVVLTISKRSESLAWIEVELTDAQWAVLGFDSLPQRSLEWWHADQIPALSRESFDLGENSTEFYNFLMQAPTPFALLSGADLCFTFANPAYSRLMHRAPQEELLGRPVREVLSDLKGNKVFDLMDQVMRTGIPYVGTEVSSIRVHKQSGQENESYFDFIYHPMHNSTGSVYGVMVQVADVTERVLTRQINEHREAQLYSQWAELEGIYKTAPVGMALFNADDLRILRINDKHAEVLRGTSDQLRGKTLLQLSSHLPELERLLLQAATGKSFRNVIIREEPQEPGGLWRSWMVNLAPSLGSSGEVATISSLFLEVPGQVWPGSGIEDSDNLISEALESTTDSVFVIDRDWNIVYLNSRARATLPEGETVLGRNHWDAFPASIELNLWAEYHRTMTERIPTSCTTFYPPNGRWYDIQAYPAKRGISVFFRDVTERRLEEEALRESERRNRTCIDLNPHMLFTMNSDGNLTDFGPHFEEMTGMSRVETVGKGFLEATHPEDRDRVIGAIQTALKTGTSMDIEWRRLRKDGQYVWMRSRAAPVVGLDGSVAYYSGCTENIDELTKLRASLKVAEAALEQVRLEARQLVRM